MISLIRCDLEDFAKNSIDFIGLDLSRISSLLIAQIERNQISRKLDTYQIMAEVKYLENLINHSETVKEEKFKHLPLRGLYKKHFMNARYLINNINAYYGTKFNGNSRLDECIQSMFDETTTKYLDESFAGKLAHQLVFKAIEERAERGLTGEWIVFQKYRDKNYYLTLATHDEDDEEIFKRVNYVLEKEFPFLKDI